MRAYYGLRHGGRVDVFRFADHEDPALTRLAIRHDLRNHSPDGFEWGYCGSGPAQLALALLADALGDDDEAGNLYQEFKRRFVTKFAHNYWTINLDAILEWADKQTPRQDMPAEEPFAGLVKMPLEPTEGDESA